MIRKIRMQSEEGFTLIELMIVIAIIGILAAIAIPNFIAYRNKSFCSAAESDANAVASAVADYFSIPSNTSVSKARISFTGTGDNSWSFTGITDPNVVITIVVTDGSGRCPSDYRSASSSWSGFNYTKTMTLD